MFPELYVSSSLCALFWGGYSGTLRQGAYIVVSSGGTATSTTVNGGCLYVSHGGTAIATTVNPDGKMFVLSGGTAIATTVNSGGSCKLYEGTMDGLDIKSGGWFIAAKTPVTIYNVFVAEGGLFDIDLSSPDTTVFGTHEVYGDFYFSNYIASNYVVGPRLPGIGDDFQVCSGGTAYHTIVNDRITVSSGGSAIDTVVNSRGSMYVSNGGTANSTTVNVGGSMYVSNGGTANSTTVNVGGSMYVSSGGTATAIKENGGYVNVAD